MSNIQKYKVNEKIKNKKKNNIYLNGRNIIIYNNNINKKNKNSRNKDIIFKNDSNISSLYEHFYFESGNNVISRTSFKYNRNITDNNLLYK